jgi:Lon protease-like protein
MPVNCSGGDAVAQERRAKVAQVVREMQSELDRLASVEDRLDDLEDVGSQEAQNLFAELLARMDSYDAEIAELRKRQDSLVRLLRTTLGVLVDGMDEPEPSLLPFD